MKRDLESELSELRTSLKDVEIWASLAESQSGQYIVQFLDKAEEETILQWNRLITGKIDEPEKTEDSLLFKMAAIRSKLQTLQALRKKFTQAIQERMRLQKELAQLEMQK